MDDLFKFYGSHEFAPQDRIAYFGWEGKGLLTFKNYIIGYTKVTELIFDEFSKAAQLGEIGVQDTLVYPLCFNYRQIVELSLKYLFMKYCNTIEYDAIEYFKEVGHNLLKSWNKIKPTLLNLIKNQGLDEKRLTNIETYILAWNEFDVDSMRMRYPVDKKFKSMNQVALKLDVVNFNEKMINLLKIFDELDWEISDQVTFWVIDELLLEELKLKYDRYKFIFADTINKLETASVVSENVWVLLDIDFRYFLGVTYLAALDVMSGQCKLSKIKSKIKNDFYKVIYMNTQNSSIDDSYLEQKIISCFSIETIKRLKFAVEILNIN